MQKCKLLAFIMAVMMVFSIVPMAASAEAEAQPSVEITDCGHFVGADWAGEDGAFSVGWQYSNIQPEEITGIRVGAKDAKGRTVVEYTADAEQIAWQIENGYFATDLNSAPFYHENEGVPIAEGRDLDWTVAKGEGFETWQPTLFYVEVTTANGTYYDEMAYDYPYPGMKITDCGHFVGADWAGEDGAFSVGWQYSNIQPEEITGIRVGAKDAQGRTVVEYTADAEQIAWQIENGYFATDLNSAPFYHENEGVPIAEGRDLDWTVAKGEGFETWQPTLFYVEVTTANGTYYDEMAYDYPYPGMKITDCGHFVGADWAGEDGAFSVGWQYSNIQPEEITGIRVGAKDAQGRTVVEYTADAEQIAWQIENGYFATDLNSAPFYHENEGVPIAEGRDLDWTVAKGEGFETWQPTLFYVEVTTANGTYYDEMAYDYDYPHVHEPVYHEEQAATCTEDGSIAYWYCEGCGKYFGDEDCTQEIAAEDIVVKAAHGKTELRDAKEATCTEAGYTGDEYCTVCGERLVTGEEIPMKPHDYQNGSCTVCGAADPNYQPPVSSDDTSSGDVSLDDTSSGDVSSDNASPDVSSAVSGPTASNGASSGSNSTSPKTGTADLAVWLFLILCSAGLLTGTVLLEKKRSR